MPVLPGLCQKTLSVGGWGREEERGREAGETKEQERTGHMRGRREGGEGVKVAGGKRRGV